MSSKQLSIIATMILATQFVSTAFATTLTVSTQAGTIQSTSQITHFDTNGAMMSGMQVTAYFYAAASPSEMVSEVLTWESLDARMGGVSGTGWSLTQSGDTFRSAWTVITEDTSLARLVIDAASGGTVFDLATPESGTRGSARGVGFSLIGSSLGNVSASYSDLVALEGQAPAGDLYRQLTIDFESGGAFAGRRSLTFLADTDNLALRPALSAAPMTPDTLDPPAAVPIPAAAWLFGSGLLGLLALHRSSRAGPIGPSRLDGRPLALRPSDVEGIYPVERRERVQLTVSLRA